MAHWAHHRPQFTEALVIIGTIFLSPITRWSLMPIYTFLAFKAVTFLLEVSAYGDLFLLIDVKVFTVLASLALALEPVDANNFL